MAKQPETLLAALAAVQAKIEAIAHDAKGQVEGRTFDYSTLPAVLAVVRPQLTKHGLVLLQPTAIEGQYLVVKTTIHHAATAESMVATYPVSQAGNSHIDMAAALTMARRSSLLSLLGIFPAGEDTNAGTQIKADAPHFGGAKPSTPPGTGFMRGKAKDDAVAVMTAALEHCNTEEDLDAQWEADAPARARISNNAAYGLSEVRERRRAEISEASYRQYLEEHDPSLLPPATPPAPDAPAPPTFSEVHKMLDACEDSEALAAWEAEHATPEKLKARAPGERAALNGLFKAKKSKFTPAQSQAQ